MKNLLRGKHIVACYFQLHGDARGALSGSPCGEAIASMIADDRELGNPGLFSDDGEGSVSAYDSGQPIAGDQNNGFLGV